LIPRHKTITRAVTHHLPGNCERVASILSRVGDKWSVLAVMVLANGPRRFNELKRLIGGVSQRMLTLTLRGLERDGLVTRTLYPSIPPRVDYELTKLGHSLREPIDAIGGWVMSHLEVIDEARRNYDQRNLQARGVLP
jgi:DNA-binding HxlR family transcriptional regulator